MNINIFENYPDVVKVNDLQSMLGVGKSTAYKLAKDGVIPSVKIGKIYLIPKQAVINYLFPSSGNGIIMRHSGLVIQKEDCKQ